MSTSIKFLIGILLFGLLIWGCSNTASSHFEDQLNEINYKTNREVRYRTYEPYSNGHPFVVYKGMKQGDCTEIQGLKAIKLIEQNLFRKEDLEPLVVYNSHREQWHLVLIAKDEYVFDNLSDIVYDYSELKTRDYIPFFETDVEGASLVQLRYMQLFNNILKEVKTYVGT